MMAEELGVELAFVSICRSFHHLCQSLLAYQRAVQKYLRESDETILHLAEVSLDWQVQMNFCY